MAILRAIGRFFAAIGRWIRDTAWVQPLLIVGGIFALIFSIPHIVNGVSSWFDTGNVSENYYHKYDLSLSGAEKGESEADKLFTYLEAKQKGEATDEQKNQYGEKFFIAFVQTGCKGCETVQPGFEKIQQEWNKGAFADMGADYKLYTIFIDEDANYDLPEKSKDLFDYFYARHGHFFEVSSDAARNRPYFDNNGGADSSYESSIDLIGDKDSFESPTSYLIDFTYAEHDDYGISEVFFAYKGYKGETTSYDYAYTLRDCWKHEGIFADNWDGK